jgi:hypothetical protein
MNCCKTCKYWKRRNNNAVFAKCELAEGIPAKGEGYDRVSYFPGYPFAGFVLFGKDFGCIHHIPKVARKATQKGN